MADSLQPDLEKHAFQRETSQIPRPKFVNQEAEWDDGGIGEWHKDHPDSSNHDNIRGQGHFLQDLQGDLHHGSVNLMSSEKSATTSSDVNKCVDIDVLEKAVLAKFDSDFNLDPEVKDREVKETESTEVSELWDSQFDFKVLESPNKKGQGQTSPLKRKLSSGQKVKDALAKGRNFIKSRVGNYKKKLLGNSVRMKSGKDGEASERRERGENPLTMQGGSERKASGERHIKQLVTSADHQDLERKVSLSKMDNLDLKFADELDGLDMYSSVNGHLVLDAADDVDTNSQAKHTGTYNLDPKVSTADDLNPGRSSSGDLDLVKESQNLEKLKKGTRQNHQIKEKETDTTEPEATRTNGELIQQNSMEQNEQLPESGISIHVEGEGKDEEIPLGSDAHQYSNGSRPAENQLIDKRLLWLQGNSENASFGSDLSHNTTTSNSSDISLDMLLQERSADPEEVLTNLGFTSGSGSDVTSRVPQRFLSNPSAADGVGITSLLEDNDELQQLLGLSESDDILDQIQTAQLKSTMNGQDHPQLGNMLASVMSGMRFLSAINHSHNLSLSQESKPEVESILQNPKNREFLEKQGYYNRFGANEKKAGSPASKTGSAADGKFAKMAKTMSLDASERRKKFHQTRSRNFSQLETSGSDVSEMGSFSYDDYRKAGAISRSFTSFENSDSFDSAEHNESRESNLEVFIGDNDDVMLHRPSISLGDISPGLMSKRSAFSVSEDSNRRSSEELIESEDSRDQGVVPRTRAYNDGLQKIAHLRKNQVDRFMTMQDADEDYVVPSMTSPPLSKEGSLESTLTTTEVHRLQKKSSTLKDEEELDSEAYRLSVERDITPVPSPKSVTFRLGGSQEDSEVKVVTVTVETEPEGTEEAKDLNSNVKGDRLLGISEEEVIKGEVMQLNASSRSVDEVDALGGMGRMESIQSDSSGFGDGDVVTENTHEERASSLGSSVESDQTSRSIVTVVSDHPASPRLQVTSSYLQNGRSHRQVEPICSKKVDVAVGTEDLNFIEEIQTKSVPKQEVCLTPGGSMTDSQGREFRNKTFSTSVNIAPTISYQLHQREKDVREEDGQNGDNSVVLTIELPTEWLQSGKTAEPPKSSVVSTLYKHIGPPNSKASPKTQAKNGASCSSNTMISSSNRNTAFNSSSNDHSKLLSARRQSYAKMTRIYPQWSSTPCVNTGKRKPKLSENLNKSQIVSPKRTIFTKLEEQNGARAARRNIFCSQDELEDRPLSPSSVSEDEYVLPIRSGGDNSYLQGGNSEDESLFNRSEMSLLSASESCVSLQGENMEYKKLLRLMNKPLKQKSSSQANPSRFRTKTNVRLWNQLEKRELLEEEIQLLQNALNKYKADLNSMEMVFRVKKKMAGDDLSPEERDELDELRQIWDEVHQEISETEQLLDNRLSGLNVGNDNFNPMLAMDVIHKMTELLKEQLFQYQICVDPQEEPETMATATQNLPASPWQPDMTQPKWGIPQYGSQPGSMYGESSLHESLVELRESILQEVRQERQELHWLHRELKNRDRELTRLRQEVTSHNVKVGTTRQKMYFESDV